MVGAIKGAVKMVTKTERVKRVQNIQTITPIRPILPKTPIQPILKTSWSNTSFIEFLYYGKE